jgi:UPF0755 protein
MRPNENPEQRPSIDGMRSAGGVQNSQGAPARKPEYRYDRELPAPKHVDLLEDGHAPDLAVTEQPTASGWSWRKKALLVLGILFALILATLAGAYVWFQQQLSPVSDDSSRRVQVTIESGTAPSTIGDQLKDAGVIRSKLAFSLYTKLTNTENMLKAGAYSLQPSQSTQEIVDHIVAGKQDTFQLTFLPGDTLANNRQVFVKAGYSEAEVDAALAKQYNRPLFAGKPASADLEGYIYGETYEFTAAASVEDVLNRTFDEYEKFITENKLVAGYRAQGLSLFEGITLASIIQKEVSGSADSKQVAQVFYKRMAEGMPLGADATFVYAAKKAGRQPTVDFPSPYNTRVNQGLPPGPISVPGTNALLAVASPAPGDFLYFVSGDDGKNYFSRTLAEHEAATRAHCIKNCALF